MKKAPTQINEQRLSGTRTSNHRDTLRDRTVEKLLKKRGFKAKIHAFCCHCIFDPYQEGTWLKQVENCTSLDCPLYSVRPTSGSYHKGTDQGSLAIGGVG